LVDKENPLTARVMANRLWEQIFGIGIVRTSEEFGSQGEPPANPELLDWLACQFRDGDDTIAPWDIKAFLKLLVTSATRPATPPAPSGRLTADEEAAVATELKQAAPRWAALLAECAGLALGYGEHQADAARYRQIAGLCIAAGVDQTLMEAWIEVGRQRASTATASTHKACVLWDS
jgi:hypothetical protein